MAAALPNWMMLERFVFRRDDPESFPDDEAAPFTVSSTTSLGDPFRVAFLVAKAPAVSRLYLQWPRGGLDPEVGESCDLVAAHRNLVLFRLNCSPIVLDGSPLPLYQQDHFICRASSSPHRPPLLLKRIPMCTQPVVLRVKNGEEITMQRPFFVHTLGLLCRGEEEFAMAQLVVDRGSSGREVEAEMCVLRSRLSDDDHGGKWEVKQQLPIRYGEDEVLDLLYWRSDTVIPFKNYLCWVNYDRGGILFCDVFEERPKVCYLRLPIDDRPRNTSQRPFLHIKRSVCVAEGGRVLKFVNVSREDGELLGPIQPGTGFTITSHTLKISESNGMEWDNGFIVTAHELWACNSHMCLPRDVLMFPLVSMDKPHVVHFLLTEYGDEIDKVSVVTIDMITKTVVSIVPYIGEEDLDGEDVDMVNAKSRLLEPFLPSELPKFLNPTREKHLPIFPFIHIPLRIVRLIFLPISVVTW